jgi:hypothetical protein
MKAHRAVKSLLDTLLGDGQPMPDPFRYYAVVMAKATVDGTELLLGYIRVGPDDIAAAVAHRLYPNVHFHLNACDFTDEQLFKIGFGETNA